MFDAYCTICANSHQGGHARTKWDINAAISVLDGNEQWRFQGEKTNVEMNENDKAAAAQQQHQQQQHHRKPTTSYTTGTAENLASHRVQFRVIPFSHGSVIVSSSQLKADPTPTEVQCGIQSPSSVSRWTLQSSGNICPHSRLDSLLQNLCPTNTTTYWLLFPPRVACKTDRATTELCFQGPRSITLIPMTLARSSFLHLPPSLSFLNCFLDRGTRTCEMTDQDLSDFRPYQLATEQ
ncbi:hypothetical protein BDP81DRAFT_218098 [Colletotrichum phormii]|uniref:Uncharacterized protein n=1 Tax=Colletotrichum phormii TaxID=359342 RepID=A0AAI9ZSL9_9PEZI|nr:uncharacterized protein BDP81DRAFT_218098 [Colletotrichum phormii]KAK1637065.1 hypothetical protein BDP81DRAFT_218098 [Colletotrichum phormii]